MRCRTLDEVAAEVLRLINDEMSAHSEPDAEFFFRGECKNHDSDYDSEPLGTAFQSYLDREGLVESERRLFEEAMRLNVASFEEDRTMVERVARMQYQQGENSMSPFHTEGLIKEVTNKDDSNVTFKLGPVAPYVLGDKKDNDSTERYLLFVRDGENPSEAKIITASQELPAHKPADFHSLIIAKANRLKVRIEVGDEQLYSAPPIIVNSIAIM